jgi:hypothetical protein
MPGRRGVGSAESEALRVALPSIRGGSIGGAGRAAAPAPAVAPERPIDGVVRCAACGRHPLVGEQVTLHAGRSGPEWACETCEGGGHGDGLGAVSGRERVRSVGGAANVHRAA